jgi:ACT domain-containing protein
MDFKKVLEKMSAKDIYDDITNLPIGREKIYEYQEYFDIQESEIKEDKELLIEIALEIEDELRENAKRSGCLYEEF